MTLKQRTADGPFYVRYQSRQLGGKRTWRSTDQTNRRDAERAAKAILDADRDPAKWELLDATKEKQTVLATLGEIFTAYRRHAGAVKTYVINRNIGALRSMIKTGRPEFAGADDQAIDRISSTILTPALASDFKRNKLALAGDNGIKQHTCKVAANSVRRQAFSLFKKEILPLYQGDVSLPATIAALKDVAPFKVEKKGFKYPADLVDKLLAQGETLRAGQPDGTAPDLNCYRIFKLGLGAGLRKNEIYGARWSWIEGDDKAGYTLTVQATADYDGPKSKRDRTVALSAAVVRDLRAARTVVALGGDAHILEGHKTERRELAFKRFSKWISSLGWTGNQKTHVLRKLAGSLVNKEHGLKAAQVFLGHADISTTADVYVAPTVTPAIKIFG